MATKGGKPWSPEKLASKLKTRRTVLKEIVSTEALYVKKLQCFVNVYIHAMEQPSFKAKFKKVANHPIVAVFFSTFQQITSVGSYLLKDLQERTKGEVTDETIVADIFINFSSLFELFGKYAQFHADVATFMRVEREKRPAFTKFLQDASQSPKANGVRDNFDMLMIEPVQRVPRYVLLLKEMVKMSPDNFHDLEQMALAISRVQVSASKINESIRTYENQQMCRKMEQLWNPTIPLVSSTNRSKIKEGTLTKIKVRRGGGQEYTFHLFTDLLLYSKPLGGGKFRCHNRFDLHECKLGDNDQATDKQFVIVSPQKAVTIEAKDKRERDQWVKAIGDCKAAIDKEMGEEKEFAPVWHSDEGKACVFCDTRFTMTNRRHHCRRCGALCCGKCSKARVVLPNVHHSNLQRVCDKCVKEMKVYEAQAEARAKAAAEKARLAAMLTPEQKAQEAFAKSNGRYGLVLDMYKFLKVYVAELEILSSVYILPILAQIKSNANKTVYYVGRPSDPIEDQVALFLYSVDGLQVIPVGVLKELEHFIDLAGWQDLPIEHQGVGIGRVFSRLGGLDFIYATFASAYKNYVKILDEHGRVDKLFRPEKKNAKPEDKLIFEEHPDNENKTIKMLVERPRVMAEKFQTFLSNFVEATPEDHDDRKALEYALGHQTPLIDTIIKAFNNTERLEKLKLLNTKFTTDINLTEDLPGIKRSLVLKGQYKKLTGGRKYKKYYFHLFSDMLLYSQQKDNKFELHRKIGLSDIKTVSQVGSKRMLMETSGKNLMMEFPDSSAQKIWYNAVSKKKNALAQVTSGLSGKSAVFVESSRSI